MCLRTNTPLSVSFVLVTLNSNLLCAPRADRPTGTYDMSPMLPVREPPQVGAGTHREGQDIDCRPGALDHNRLESVFRNAWREATVSIP